MAARVAPIASISIARASALLQVSMVAVGVAGNTVSQKRGVKCWSTIGRKENEKKHGLFGRLAC